MRTDATVALPRNFAPIPEDWRRSPPDSFVVGDGPYASALALVVGVAPLAIGNLLNGPQPNAAGGYPRVFENLRRVFLVVRDHMSAAEALECHGAVWNWIGKIASAGDQHDVSFLFILSESSSNAFEEAIAIGLGLPALDPGTTGHAAWRRSGLLGQLMEVVSRTQPMDLLVLKGRQAADIKRQALVRLRQAVGQGDAASAAECARSVLNIFGRMEHSLDVFCLAPSHRHGNLLRAWLSAAETEPVTQQWLNTGRERLSEWLSGSVNGTT